MKKIFALIVAMFMVFGMATAQTTVNEGVFSHMYIGINAGANQTTVSDYSNWDNGFTNGLKTLTYNAGLELGKDVTPITGFSLQGNVAPIYHNDLNMNPEWTINHSDVFGNVKFNLMNLFGGYKGYPRRIEMKTVTGIGWNHFYGEDVENPNDVALQAGLEFDFNLGKNRNWFITFTPMVQANQILKSNEIQFAAEGADLKANIGVAYRLGRGNQNHSFKICDKVYTEQQYADLYALYDECMNRPVQVDTVVVENITETVVLTPTMLSNAVIVFPKNSAELGEAEIHRLDIIMEALDKEGSYIVCGSADSGTGTPEINERLSTERANVVKELLEKNGFKNVETTTKLDAFNDAEISRCAIIRIK
jgi:outer membrane protein OmpA-like peptidoglycan-associated protein